MSTPEGCKTKTRVRSGRNEGVERAGRQGKKAKQGGDSGERSRSLRMLEAKMEGPTRRRSKKRRLGRERDKGVVIREKGNKGRKSD